MLDAPMQLCKYSNTGLVLLCRHRLIALLLATWVMCWIGLPHQPVAINISSEELSIQRWTSCAVRITTTQVLVGLTVIETDVVCTLDGLVSARQLSPCSCAHSFCLQSILCNLCLHSECEYIGARLSIELLQAFS